MVNGDERLEALVREGEGDDRALARLWATRVERLRPRFSEVRYRRDDLCTMGVAAVCLDGHGRLWEFEGGQVYVHDEAAHSRHAVPLHLAPGGPWRHSVTCGCEVCRLGVA